MTSDDSYERHKDQARERQAEQSRRGRDIGKIPAPKDPKRREKCRLNLKLYLETYLPHQFPLGWSKAHLAAIRRCQDVVLNGGRLALAMWRGAGKTTILRGAVIWALCYGHTPYAVLFSSTQELAIEQLMQPIKTVFETVVKIGEDFPEVCVPIRKLEGQNNKCKGQTCEGVATRIQWGLKKIVLPAIAGSAASECVLTVKGFGGASRGGQHTRASGEVVRPRLIFFDDPQTADSARSTPQNTKRAKFIARDAMGMAGPGESMSALMACTRIEADDCVSQILDRKKNPEWRGEIYKLLESFPTNMQRWEEYHVLRGELFDQGLEEPQVMAKLNAFYRKHRKEMDAGSVVNWPERVKKLYVSAIQDAMTLYLSDSAGFFAEYQNDPQKEQLGTESDVPPVDVLCKKQHKLSRGKIPGTAVALTSFCDVHESLLYWMMMAWADTGQGWIVDYSTWPQQAKTMFAMRDANPTMCKATGNKSVLAATRKGLDELIAKLVHGQWFTDVGQPIELGRMLIDVGYTETASAVFDAIRESGRPSVLRASKGKGLGANEKPMREWPRREGEKRHPHWIDSPNAKRVRSTLIDVNFWKSRAAEALAMPFGDPGSVSLFEAQPFIHRNLAEHFHAETKLQKAGSGSVIVDQWQAKSNKPDNHWWDCLVGNLVAASQLGIKTKTTLVSAGGAPFAPPEKKKKRQRTASFIE